MAEFASRNGVNYGGNSNRKRRFRGDDDYDRRPQRRRFEEPLHVKIRKQLLAIAESPLRRSDEEVTGIANLVANNYEEEQIKSLFLSLSLQLIVEQPLKIPFVAGVVLAGNPRKPDLVSDMLQATVAKLHDCLTSGAWREIKLLLKFLGCLQGVLEGSGLFPVLEDLFARAVDLQTASSEDSLGLELVKIILVTLPYMMTTNADVLSDQALAILDKTEVIASTPHVLYALANPRPLDDSETQDSLSFIGQLQKQLQAEADQGWKLACIARPWNPMEGFNATDDSSPKHALPNIAIPSPVIAGPHPLLPEIYFSVYGGQEIETVPSPSNLAASLVRDALVDTINIIDFNRNAAAKFLIDVDCYFAEDVFVKRATQFDKLRHLDEGKSTWKPEDIAVDAVFSQLFQLPAPEHKLVYYHSVLTEACRIAPAAVAPSLGRAIRWFYANIHALDLEVVYRFMDWFAHHLSNFGFTWKWVEWVDDVELPLVHPKKAFMLGALEKEIRLSFAARIRGTLPDPYRPLIKESEDDETPPFKYHSEQTPYAEQGRHILQLLKSKAPDTEIQETLSRIEELAGSYALPDPSLPSTDAFMTTICYLGSKSLSHTLSQIERSKDRLLTIGPRSEAARRQIISSVLEYWSEKPGVGVAIIDKLLNYTILTPQSVVQWALVDQLGKGQILAKAYVYEIIAATIAKVTGRVRQVVEARNAPSLPYEQQAILDETLASERDGLNNLFVLIEDALTGIAEGSNDAMAEGADQDTEEESYLRTWGKRWLMVINRRKAVEASWVEEKLQERERMVEDVKRHGGSDDLNNVQHVGEAPEPVTTDEVS